MSSHFEQLPERLPPTDMPIIDEATFYQKYPAPQFVANLERRAPRWGRYLALGAAVSAALLVALIVPWSALEENQPYGTVGNLRDKGNVPEPGTVALGLSGAARFHVLTDGRFVELQSGATLPGKSLLRFYYDTTSADYLYLFSVDERGRISTYYPEERGFSVPIVRGRNVPLPDGVMLDDYVGDERFFALFSARPLSFVEVELAVATELLRLHQVGKGIKELERVPLNCHQETLHIVKR
jgi:hypothetical protein